MPPPDYISSAVPAGNPTTSFTITIPTVQVGDVLILNVINGGATADPSVTDNDTDGNIWAKMIGVTGAVRAASVWWKRATAASSAKIITVSGLTNSSTGTLDVYRGCVSFGNPYQRAEAAQHNAGIETRSGIITTVNNAMVCLSIFSAGQNAPANQACTAPGALIERSEKISTGGLDTTASHASEVKILSGATGAFTWAQTDAVTFSIAFALMPVPPAITFPDQLGWRIYYADDSIVTGTTLADWDAAPDTGVVAIVEIFAKGANRIQSRYTIDVHAGDDFYWMAPDFTEYVHKNVTHILDSLEIGSGPARLIPPNAHVKSGQLVGDSQYNTIVNAASTPPDFGTFP